MYYHPEAEYKSERVNVKAFATSKQPTAGVAGEGVGVDVGAGDGAGVSIIVHSFSFNAPSFDFFPSGHLVQVPSKPTGIP